MRLINSSTLELEEFGGDQVPRYAVLSHRWSSVNDEVSYKEYRKGLKKETSGYAKIRRFCAQALEHGLSYVWIDTACIDKRSSAELSEAINSMFDLYRRASICYAYLSDVGLREDWAASQWWQRGWTLQELIAPADVVFLDRDWRHIGTKRGMAAHIEAITTIPQSVLLSGEYRMYRHWTVAQKMSWAAGRRTTRVEDTAYCLLGIFHINMPLLYGEGTKAFQRLQLEILQKYSDESIFAWKHSPRERHHGLAISPDEFRDCEKMSPPNRDQDIHSQAYRVSPPRVTSWGIELRANARRLTPRGPIHKGAKEGASYWAITLTTAWDGKMRELPCTMILESCGPAPTIYRRLDCHYAPPEHAVDSLRQLYNVHDFERDKLFYLRFDSDFKY